MRILISGFVPFGGRDINPTALLIEALQKKEVSCPAGAVIGPVLLPVTFADAFEALQRRSKEFLPDVILSLGLAANRSMVELERVAINCIDAEIPDNEGKMPKDLPVNPLGKEAHFSTLPLRELEDALKQAGIRARISNSAGTYVCNYLFYKMMETWPDKACGFVHLPLHSELPHSEQVRALEVMLRVLGPAAAQP